MSVEQTEAFRQIVLILGVTTLGGMVASLFRQPLIMAFIVVGLLVGPAGLGLVEVVGPVELFGRMGIALLLFIVGLKLDLGLIRTSGFVAVVSGIGQVVITAVIGLLLAVAMGMSLVPALYVSLALTFSSTVIVVKLLSDRREIDSLHGRIALGILLVQDMLAISVLVVLAGLSKVDPGRSVLAELVFTFLRGLGFLMLVGGGARYLFPRIERWISASPEMLVLGGIAWAVGMAAGADLIGFSLEIGAFAAGVSLAGHAQGNLVAARLVSLRDFLLLFFFVNLGARISVADMQTQLLPGLLLALFVLVGNPLIVVGIMVAMKFRVRTGFLAGVTLAQISEFSFVLMALGLSLGHTTERDVALVSLVGLATFGVSTYMIIYAHQFFQRVQKFLHWAERRTFHPEEIASTEWSGLPEVIVFGVGRHGTVLLTRLRERGIETLGVDFDPVAVRRGSQAGFHVRFGDAEDPEYVGTLPLASTKLIVCTTPLPEVETTLLHALRSHGYLGPTVLTSPTADAAEKLRRAGADLVLLPYEAAAERAAEVVRAVLQVPGFLDKVRAQPRVPVPEEPAGAFSGEP